MDSVQVIGWRELRRSLRQIDRSAPRGLREAGNKAAEIVVRAAQPRVPFGPPQGGHARSSIRKASTQGRAAVKGGSARYPYYGWLEFGGRVGRNRSVHRPFLRGGRYMFPAYHDNRMQVRDELESELRRIAREAGVRVF